MIGKKLVKAIFRNRFLNTGDLSPRHLRLEQLKFRHSIFVNLPANLVKDPFWLLLLISVGAHAAFWLLLPNPIEQTNDRQLPEEIEVVSVVPVVSLPANSKPIAPVTEPLTTPPLDRLADADVELNPADSDRQPFDSIPAESDPNSRQIIALDPQESLEQEDIDQPDDRLDPQNEQDRDENGQDDQKIAQTETEIDSEPSQDQQIDQATNADDLKTANNPDDADLDTKNIFFKGDRNNDQLDSINTDSLSLTNVSEEIISNNEQAFLQVISDNKYKGKLVIRVIAPAGKVVKSEQREPQVAWIPLDIAKLEDLKAEINSLSKEGKEINIALLVNPEGTVEKSFIETSNIKELDAIISNTARGYYDKFEPISQQSDSQAALSKYRYVTVKYELDQFNFN